MKKLLLSGLVVVAFILYSLHQHQETSGAVSPSVPTGQSTAQQPSSNARPTTYKDGQYTGGIGITPYRSMIKYLLDTVDPRQITLLYSEKTAAELVYTDVFEAARQQLETRVVYVLENAGSEWQGQRGLITADIITAEIPDYRERLFYISGPYPMIIAMKQLLHGLGVRGSHIKTDYFPGYA